MTESLELFMNRFNGGTLNPPPARERTFLMPLPPSGHKRNFSGIMTTPENPNVPAWFQDINWVMRNMIIPLKMTSRYMYANDPVVTRIVDSGVKNIVGHTGFALVNESADEKFNEAIEYHWRDFSKARHLSANGQESFTSFCQTVVRNYYIDGEAFIHIIRDPKYKYGMALQLLDSLAVDSFFNGKGTHGEIIAGIEVDQYGKPIYYHLATKPGYFSNIASGIPSRMSCVPASEHLIVPAEDILHIYTPVYAGQVHGFPKCACIMKMLNSMHEYTQAEITAARIFSEKVIYFVAQNEVALENYGKSRKELSAMDMDVLPAGVDMKQLDPDHPVSGFNDFMVKIMELISAGSSEAYHEVSGDMSKTNYSSSRLASISAQNQYKIEQGRMIDTFLIPLFDQWAMNVFLKFGIGHDVKNINPEFLGRVFDWVDPEKDERATAIPLAAGLTDPITESRRRGKDYRQTQRRWAQWLKDSEKAGLDPKIFLAGMAQEASRAVSAIILDDPDPAGAQPDAKPAKKAAETRDRKNKNRESAGTK